jgi:heme/copper-type cytochrome/quinol oxidase subunit 3
MHRIQYGGYLAVFGLLVIIIVSVLWFTDITDEATFVGFHSLVVRTGLRSGFLLFIVSEIMLFFGFF